ncbi:copper resistance D family protein [Skermanella stibiiresistens]|uniref:copper resistance D family protein n=1 Tax=Skermanella stibiiresistens TaxID=913326 RepID=UPI00247FB5DE|nr:CopD family protein [Skermanella stibiiresistens]
MIHGIGIAAWIGALVPLGVLLAGRSPESVPALCRFSRAAPFVLAPMVAAGVILAVIQVEHPGALLDTGYGRVLLVKLALLTALFALAALNRWRLTGPALSPAPEATRPLTRSIAAELALAVMILGVAACWRFTPPPRVLALAAAQPAQTHMASAEAMADLTVTPGHAGPVKASIIILSGEFGPLDARSVALTLTDPAAGAGARSEPITRQALRHDDGIWRVDDLTIPRPGRWTAHVDIRITDKLSTSLDGEVDIRR